MPVLTQITSGIKALEGVDLGLVENTSANCVRDAIDESDEAGDAKIAEATAAIARLLRS